MIPPTNSKFMILTTMLYFLTWRKKERNSESLEFYIHFNFPDSRFSLPISLKEFDLDAKTLETTGKSNSKSGL